LVRGYVAAAVLAGALAAIACGPTPNCTLTCAIDQRFHNATSEPVDLVLDRPPVRYLRIEPDAKATVTYPVPRTGDLSRQFVTFRVLSTQGSIVFCRSYSYSEIIKLSIVEIVGGVNQCD